MMFAKKKPIVALPRTRFAKAKPKIGPKSSQSTSQSEKKLEKTSVEDVDLSASEKTENEVFKTIDSRRTSNEEVDLSASEKTENEVSKTSDCTRSLNEVCIDPVEQNLKEVSHSECILSQSPKSKCLLTSDASPEKSAVIANESDSVLKRALETSLDDSISESLKSSYEAAICVASNKDISECRTDHGNKTSSSYKVNERRKKMAALKELPPRSEMTFSDLIYWNPKTSPMKSKEKNPVVYFDSKETESNGAEEEAEEGEDDSSNLAPKLFVNENGEIIIDETSLVIKRKKKDVDMTVAAINVDDLDASYGSYRKKSISNKWTPKETVNFYKALSVVGTDFALMESIIPNRTRRELKIKFKKEEKINNELLQRAMYETDTFQSDLTAEDLDLEVIDIPGLEETIAEENDKPKTNGRKRKKKVLTEIASSDVEGTDNLPPKKRRGRQKSKKNDVNSSKLPDPSTCILQPEIENDLTEENESSQDVSIKRKLPKKTYSKVSLKKSHESYSKVTQESTDSNGDLHEIQVEYYFEDNSTFNENAASNSTERSLSVEDNDFSPVVRAKRKAKVLSQDSTEEREIIAEGDYEFSPIVRVMSEVSIENNDLNINAETSINPEESPTKATSNLASLVEFPCTLQELSPKLNSSLANGDSQSPISHIVSQNSTNHDFSDLTSKPVVKLEKLPFPESVIAAAKNATEAIEPNKESNGEEISSTATTSEIKNSQNVSSSDINSAANNIVATYRRTRKIKTLPNIKNAVSKPSLDKPGDQEIPIVISPESLSIIDLTGDRLLSDCVTDVVTTAAVTKKQRTKPNILPGKPELKGNFSAKKGLPISKNPTVKLETEKHTKHLQPSYLNYTPVLDDCDQCTLLFNNGINAKCSKCSTFDAPRLGKNQKTYSRKKLIDNSPIININSPSCSLQMSVITPINAAKLQNINSSPYVSSLNMSSNKTISIAMTPEPACEKESVVVPTLSTTNKGLHINFGNSFSGGTPLPPEILVPPSDIMFKSEKQ